MPPPGWVADSLSGVDPDFSVDVSLVVDQDEAEVSLAASPTDLSVPELEFVVQVLDVEGLDVVAPLMSGAIQAVSEDGVPPPASVGLPSLPDGYFAVRTTALATTVGPANGDDAKESDDGAGPELELQKVVSEVLYVSIADGIPTQVTYSEWFFNSGASSVTGPYQEEEDEG